MMRNEFDRNKLKKISDLVWEIGKNKSMRVPVRIYANEKLIMGMDTNVFIQASNVATLPGILKYSFVMPDGHSGYGFPIGGVMASDVNNNGVISPGGIGFDINCGMRLMLTNLNYKDVKPKLKEIINKIFEYVPVGVGSRGFVKISRQQFKDICERGVLWAIENGYGWEEDIKRCDMNGLANWADIEFVSEKAIKRGFDQIGTLGSGNHYLEIQVVEDRNIYDKNIAKKWGIFAGQVVIMWHCGSRGFGHQIATDYLQLFLNVMERKYNIKILDRELACAPFFSVEGQKYYKAMGCAINMSFVNRQVIGHRIREVFANIFKEDAESLGMNVLYDVCHNRASIETHKIDSSVKEVLIHRKGATGSYPAGMKEIPKLYRDDGSPVIIGGSMETGSFLMVGDENAYETFCSTAHGSGRVMSRHKAVRIFGSTIRKHVNELWEKKGIYIKAVSFKGLAEEIGKAYKNVDDVVEVVHNAKLSRKVVKFIPIGNIKG